MGASAHPTRRDTQPPEWARNWQRRPHQAGTTSAHCLQGRARSRPPCALCPAQKMHRKNQKPGAWPTRNLGGKCHAGRDRSRSYAHARPNREGPERRLTNPTALRTLPYPTAQHRTEFNSYFLETQESRKLASNVLKGRGRNISPRNYQEETCAPEFAKFAVK